MSRIEGVHSSVLLFLLAGCAVSGTPSSDPTRDDPTPADGFTCDAPISAIELATFQGYFPDTDCGQRVQVPEAFLPIEDVERGNTAVEVLYDGDGVVQGMTRTIFTPVDCAAGVCEAIRFVLVFEPDTTFVDVFHPEGSPNGLKKYFDGEYLDFTDEDMNLLRAQCQNPPQLLVDAPDNDSLVEGTNGSAPTRPEYQPYVVRGAAFTCYMIVNHVLETQEILDGVLAGLEAGR